MCITKECFCTYEGGRLGSAGAGQGSAWACRGGGLAGGDRSAAGLDAVVRGQAFPDHAVIQGRGRLVCCTGHKCLQQETRLVRSKCSIADTQEQAETRLGHAGLTLLCKHSIPALETSEPAAFASMRPTDTGTDLYRILKKTVYTCQGAHRGGQVVD